MNSVEEPVSYVKERNAIASHVDKEDALKCSVPPKKRTIKALFSNHCY